MTTSAASTVHHTEGSDPIPGALNIALALASISAAIGLLWLASHTASWPLRIAAAFAFSYVNNTIFSLLHEAVHGNFHSNHAVNDFFGRLTAALFPTAFRFQQVCHLGHHRRNRTDDEMFDFYKPGDNKLMKYIQWYGILTGIYWIMAPLGCLLYLVCPWALRLSPFRDEDSKLARQTSLDAMISGFDYMPGTRIRLEIMFTIVFQTLLFYALRLNFTGWALCYAFFAFNWSSLQYADHAWTELDVKNGAWNLKVNRIVQYIFLNYHHHRVHHQDPSVPWLHLSKHIDPSEPRPSFLAIYLSMWRGPRPYPSGDPPQRTKPIVPDLDRDLDLDLPNSSTPSTSVAPPNHNVLEQRA